MTDQVGSVLQEALDNRSNGKGTGAAVHTFQAGLNLDPFIVRRQWLGRLENTTHLYPVKQLVSGINVGQPLMHTGDGLIQILLRQPGQSITQLWEQCGNLEIWPKLLMKEIDELAKRHGNPFVKILDEAYAIGELGYTADVAPGNLLIDQDAGCLRQVDQCVDPRSYLGSSCAESNLERCVRELAITIVRSTINNKKPFDVPLNADGDRVQQRINAMVEDAYQVVLKRHSKNAYTPCVFADVSDVKAVALSDPTHVLAETLRRLSERTGIVTSR